ncbi:MAG: DUF2459 domain-containing protein [Planctomycetota bacterium]
MDLKPLLGVLLLAACATTVTPPSAVRDPVTVYMAEYGRHSALFLPRADGTWVEYTFGEWEWFARNNTGALRAFPAMLWPTQGTLGRDPKAHKPQGHSLRVEKAASATLLTELDTAFESEFETRIFNDYMNMEFVHFRQDFSACNNCNGVMVKWLRTLGCDVSGSGLCSSWKFAPQP